MPLVVKGSRAQPPGGREGKIPGDSEGDHEREQDPDPAWGDPRGAEAEAFPSQKGQHCRQAQHKEGIGLDCFGEASVQQRVGGAQSSATGA